MSVTLKTKFIDDHKLPLRPWEDAALWVYYLDLYESHLQTRTLWQRFQSLVEAAGGESCWLQKFHECLGNTIENTVTSPACQKLAADTMNNYPARFQQGKRITIYSPANHGKTFISIDLVKANFQALKFYDPATLQGAENYRDFLAQHFSDQFSPEAVDYIAGCKKIRQVIFGKINTRQVTAIERYMTSMAIERLLAKPGFQFSDIVSYAADEFIIEYSAQRIAAVKQMVRGLPQFQFHIRVFRLVSLVPGSKYIIKQFPDGRVQFMCTGKDIFVQVYKKYNGMSLNDKDLYFMVKLPTMDNFLKARFEEPLYV